MWRRGNDTVVSASGRVRTGKQCSPAFVLISPGILPRTPHAARGLIGGDESGWLHRRSPGRLRLDRDGSRNRLRCDVQAVRYGTDGPQVLRRGETERVRHAEAADVCLLEDAPAGGRAGCYRVE